VRVEHRHKSLVKRGNAAGVERQFLTRFIADPQHDGMAAQVKRQSERAAAARRRRQSREAAGIGLESDVPPVVDPRGVGDPDLAQHLRREMQDRQGLMVVLDAELGPVAHDALLHFLAPLHFALRHC